MGYLCSGAVRVAGTAGAGWKSVVDAAHPEESEAKTNLLTWLVMHAGDGMTRFRKGPDGHTAYKRIKGRNPTVRVAVRRQGFVGSRTRQEEA